MHQLELNGREPALAPAHPRRVPYLAAAVAALIFMPLTQGRAAETVDLTDELDSGGKLIPEQVAYDARFYDLNLTIDPQAKTVGGVVTVRAKVVAPLKQLVLDLDKRFTVSAAKLVQGRKPLQFARREGRLWIDLPRSYQPKETVEVAVTYSGQPRVAPRPPWVGGFTWSQTADGQPWIGVSCQLDGADVWWPVKDHPSDEPDEGVALHFTVPEALTVVSNGRFVGTKKNGNGTATWSWRVTTTINTYDVTFNAAPFKSMQQQFTSVSGRTFPVTYWVLPEDYEKGQKLFPELIQHLAWIEKKFGPYPFQSDKYAVVETPYLAMEHQTNISYGNGFDITRMGDFHFIPFHELVHEWWGNLVTASDWRDFWLHESFTGYTEALYVEDLYGINANYEYLARFVRNKLKENQVVAPLEPTSMRAPAQKGYPSWKGIMVLHTLRYVIGDEKFFELLRRQAYPDAKNTKLDGCPQCRNASTAELIKLAESVSGQQLDWFFDLYVRRPELPRLVVEDRGQKLHIRWEVPPGVRFPMPVEVERNGVRQRMAMAGEEIAIDKQPSDVIEVDPDFRVLQVAIPDPDRFGTRGKGPKPDYWDKLNRPQPKPQPANN